MAGNTGLEVYKATAIILIIAAATAAWLFMSGDALNPDAPEMTPAGGAILLAVGLATGILGGIIGSGGGTMMLPILHFWLGYPAPTAIGTTLFAAMFTAASGGYGHLIRKNVDIKTALWLGGFGVIGVIPGSWLFGVFMGQASLLELMLGIIFILPALKMVSEGIAANRKQQQQEERNVIYGSRARMAIFGFAIGTITGLVGLGGGYALVPGLIYLFNAPVYVTIGTSLAVIMPISIVGGMIKLLQGVVCLEAGLLLALGTAIGAQIGASVIKEFKPATLKLILGVYFSYVSIKFILLYFGITI